ncbi:transposase family protein, partial [Streptomyces sp. NPDC048489]|uniref:transposase family protein n=1 Tax=Streptomyces sp. NPDC048489 TaxID=3154504 RepID=UPI003419BA6F
RRAIGSRWRRLNPGCQALLAVVHLRMGHTHTQLAAGLAIGTSTVYPHVTEAVELLTDAIGAVSTRRS